MLHRSLRAVILDWDGTVSTLRCGWETVMEPLMLEMIAPSGAPDALRKEVAAYIDTSTGIQTIFQMEWLRDRVVSYGENPEHHDAWWYKDAYNRRLMELVENRLVDLESGRKTCEDYTIAGSRAFLEYLSSKGIALYVASGTDHSDVVREVAALGFTPYFAGIAGAPYRKAACSKEAVIRELMQKQNIPPENLMVMGDGKVEIRLGKESGAFTLGVASDEKALHGINEAKYRRLQAAGADEIIGDYTDLHGLCALIGLEETK